MLKSLISSVLKVIPITVFDNGDSGSTPVESGFLQWEAGSNLQWEAGSSFFWKK